MPGWSTPSPRQKYVEPYKFFPKSPDSFQRSGSRRPAALIVKPINQRLTSSSKIYSISNENFVEWDEIFIRDSSNDNEKEKRKKKFD